MNLMPIKQLPALHKDCILRWKTELQSTRSGTLEADTSKDPVLLSERCSSDFLGLVEENHLFNFKLWHAEDRARREDMGADFVYKAKRAIDSFNQQRNNRMEAMDEWLFKALNPALPGDCPVHSETPGMMIDRLSILALKSFHMEKQTERSDVDAAHREACLKKLTVIHLQQQQLQACLESLLSEVITKARTYRVYHQFKMYNDPALNPELYAK